MKLIFILFLLIVGRVHASESYEVIGSSIKLDGERTCTLDRVPNFAVESYDKSAVIVSEAAYVITSDLAHCQAARVVHVFSIPSNLGVLTDINISKGIYVALDFVSVQPFAYLATVARIGSRRNLVSMKGAYLAGQKLSDLKKYAFGGNADAGTSIISPNGRFVAPDGRIACTKDAYPGVWDIHRNQRVVTTSDACSALFRSTR
jgi:hypothetical protein